MRHQLVTQRPRGFTMVELVVVIVILGVLGAVAAPKLLSRQNLDAGIYAEQAKSILKLAQRLSVAQRRVITVSTANNAIAACYGFPCNAGNVVPAPGRSNSGSSATQAACRINGVYIANWLCEGAPAGANLNNGGLANFSFGLNGLPSSAVAYTVSGSGAAHAISVEGATGYVH
jgi:MSHA pilin protein MshC